MRVCRKYKRQFCVAIMMLMLICRFDGVSVNALDISNPMHTIMAGSTATFVSGITEMTRSAPVSIHFLAVGKAIDIPKSGSSGGIAAFFKGLASGLGGLIKFIGKIITWPFKMIFKFWAGVLKSFQTMYKMVKSVITFIQTLGKTIRAPFEAVGGGMQSIIDNLRSIKIGKLQPFKGLADILQGFLDTMSGVLEQLWGLLKVIVVVLAIAIAIPLLIGLLIYLKFLFKMGKLTFKFGKFTVKTAVKVGQAGVSAGKKAIGKIEEAKEKRDEQAALKAAESETDVLPVPSDLPALPAPSNSDEEKTTDIVAVDF